MFSMKEKKTNFYFVDLRMQGEDSVFLRSSSYMQTLFTVNTLFMTNTIEMYMLNMMLLLCFA